MLRFHHGITLWPVQSDLSSNPRLLVEHLYNLTGQTDVHLFADQVERNGVFVDAVGDQIVIADLGMQAGS